MGKNLYSNKTYFKLISGNKEILTDEPLNWDKVEINLPRDPVYFGFVFEFISDEISLQWPEQDEKAYNFIKNIYDANYGEGQIILEFGILSNPELRIQFNLNLNTYVREYEDGQNVITCSASKLTFEDLFRTRFESDIDISKTVNLNNDPIIPASPVNMTLHSRKITKQFKSFTSDTRETNSYSPDLNIGRFINVQVDIFDSQVSELDGAQGLPLSVSGIDPRDNNLYTFKVVEAGVYDISFKASFHFLVRRATLGNVGNFYFVPRLMIRRGTNTIEYTEFNQFRQSGSGNSIKVEFDMNCEVSHLKRTLLVGDELFIDFNGTMGQSGAKYYYFIGNYTSETDIVAETVAVDTVIKAYRAGDVLNKLLEYATGKENALVAPIFEFGGELYNLYLANGYSVRNFQVDEKPFITSIKAFFESVFAFRGLGYGITTIGGVEKLSVGTMRYFYQNRAIKYLKNVYDYREEHAKDKTFNEFDIGYSKFPDSDNNTLDEYNTYQTGNFPIKSYKSKFTKKSSYIPSGYAIERQRREQFKENPSESLNYDDDIFMISGIKDRVYYSTQFTANSNKTINTSKPLSYVFVGAVIKCERASTYQYNLDRVWTVTGITEEPDGSVTYTVDNTVTTESGMGVFSTVIDGIKAEKNELFNNIENVLSPDTVYNLRISPMRMRFNWAPYLNIGLSARPKTDVIQTGFMKNNSKMRSQLDGFDPFQDNLSVGEDLVESQDVTLQLFSEGERQALHTPKYAYFKSDLSFPDFLDIRDRLTGNSGEGANLGYVVHPDDTGQLIKSYVVDLKYTPNNQVAQFQVAIISPVNKTPTAGGFDYVFDFNLS